MMVLISSSFFHSSRFTKMFGDEIYIFLLTQQQQELLCLRIRTTGKLQDSVKIQQICFSDKIHVILKLNFVPKILADLAFALCVLFSVFLLQ